MTPVGDKNLTVAFESAWHYGLNVTRRPDAEVFPIGSDDVREFGLVEMRFYSDLFSTSLNILVCVNGCGKLHLILVGIG